MNIFRSDIVNWVNNNSSKLSEEEELYLIGNNSGNFAEECFESYLLFMGKDYQKQYKIENFRFDFRTNDAIYEIKSMKYNMTGTAAEKISYSPIKYRNVISEKLPLNIILFGKLESCEILDIIYNNQTTEKDKIIQQFFKLLHSTFIPFSMLLNDILRKAKPPLKWVGGKQTIAKYISGKLPNGIYFFEPFLGGGSILIENLIKHKYKYYYVNDINEELINFYIDLRDNFDELIQELEILEKLNTAEEYYKIRKEFNYHEKSIKQSARLLYLNKTCFRGIYRVNKSNEFNSPYGNYKSLNFNYDNLYLISRMIETVSFNNLHWKDFLDLYLNETTIENTVIYMDPPYLNAFNKYSKDEFNHDELIDYINDNTNIYISNSTLFANYIDKNKYEIKEIFLNNFINANNPGEIRKEIFAYMK